VKYFWLSIKDILGKIINLLWVNINWVIKGTNSKPESPLISISSIALLIKKSED
jgi:hypothetical protein